MKKKFLSCILALMLLGNMPAYADADFTDVEEADYFYVSVLFSSEKGIIDGVGNNLFNPDGILTFGEAIKIASCIHANFYEKILTPYEVSTHWADAYYDYAVENGIISETDFSKADFDKVITRDRLFFIFANTLPESEYFEINEVELAPEVPVADYIKKLFCAGIVIGSDVGFELENSIKRADAVMVVSRMTAYTRRLLVFENDAE